MRTVLRDGRALFAVACIILFTLATAVLAANILFTREHRATVRHVQWQVEDAAAELADIEADIAKARAELTEVQGTLAKQEEQLSSREGFLP